MYKVAITDIVESHIGAVLGKNNFELGCIDVNFSVLF